MPVNPWLWISAVLLVLALVAQGFFARVQAALIGGRRSRVGHVPNADPERLQMAEQLLETPGPCAQAARISALLFEVVVFAGAAGIAVALAAPAAARVVSGAVDPDQALLSAILPWVALSLLIAVLAVRLFGELVPRSLAAQEPEAFLVRHAGFLRAYSAALRPLTMLIRWAGRTAGPAGPEPREATGAARTEEEIRTIVGGSAEEGVIEPEEKEMIHSIFDFTETAARQIMIPRVEIHGLEETATLKEAAETILEEGHTRLPVYRATLDHVIGILHAKDLIRHMIEGRSDLPVRELIRKPFFVPETKKLDELLAEFRQHRTQMAIVVDEFGGTSGLVTLEDVLEEIVGEIQDEYDTEEPAIQEVDTHTAIVDAHLAIDDVNDALDLGLPSGDYETLGGFVYDLFGRPPEVGEQTEYHGIRFVVEEAEGPRLLKVRVIAPPGSEPPRRDGGEA